MVVSSLKLRQMNEADRDAVGFVGFAAWRAGEAFDAAYLDSHVIERVRDEFESFAKSPTGDVVVAEIDGVVVGWGACDAKPHHISDLWVGPTWQGKGIGKALILHFLDRMRAAGLPLGLQLIGKPFEEETLFKTAHAIEQAAGKFTPAKWW